MDLISREAVDDMIYDYSRSCDVNYGQLSEQLYAIPSAFEGMTNGESLLAVYPNTEVEICEKYNTVRVWFAIDKDHHFKDISFGLDWWNAPYKGVSE